MLCTLPRCKRSDSTGEKRKKKYARARRGRPCSSVDMSGSTGFDLEASEEVELRVSSRPDVASFQPQDKIHIHDKPNMSSRITNV
jgi:hypothetical protein